MDAIESRTGWSPLFVVAGYAAIASGILAIPMGLTLAAMFAGFAIGPAARETALRFGTINDTLKEVKVFLAGRVEQDVFIVGRTESGWAGLKTRVVQT